MTIRNPWKDPLFLLLSLVLLAGTLSACDATVTPPPVSLGPQIQAAVAATLAAIPPATQAPLPTMAPPPTPVSIENIFCEYGFCIGHPQDLYMVDQGATRQPPAAGTFSSGILFGYNPSLFVEMAWTVSGPSFDPQVTMRYILEENETLQGNLEAKLIGKINLSYQNITTISGALPFGGIAAWQCGGRDFTWKVYTPQEGMPATLIQQAVEKFRCE